MREITYGEYIIGVDHGYGNIKSATTVTKTGVLKYDTEPIFDGKTIEYNGKFYCFGENHKDFIADKSLDEDFYLCTLLAVARELSQRNIYTANVHLAVGLPLTWIRSQKDTFRQYLLQNKNVKFKYKKKDYDITFLDCLIFPQGYAAIAERIREFTDTNIVADIGNGTMNIMYINNKKTIESKCWTEKLGVEQCVIAAKNNFMDKYGIKIDDSIVENILRNGTANIDAEYLKCITDTVVKYVADIFNALNRYEYNPKLMHLYIIGGGGCLIKNFGVYDKDRVTITDDICAAAKGYEYLANITLKKARKN